ncbi:MAG: OmpH family outer membrane protein, partial [Cytophagales bacterium]|nr:OmpH family outer membrane protein [Cytophagales bacterium]
MNLLRTKHLFLALGLCLSQLAFSQTKSLKIGYTNVDYILSLMPESKTVESELKSYKQQLDNQLQTKIKEFQEKNQAYEKGQGMMTDVVRADKEKELQTMYASIEEFQKNAEASMQKKQLALLQPLLEKVQKGIDDVANENGYSYVFNSDAGFGTTPFILHAPES